MSIPCCCYPRHIPGPTAARNFRVKISTARSFQNFRAQSFSARSLVLLALLLRDASACIPTTIGRRFRHAEPKILCFLDEFFLTSFPQPPILRFQARGRISWPQRFLLPPTSRRAGPSLTENLKGPYPTTRSASVFLRRLAGLLSLFFRRERCFLPLLRPAAPHKRNFSCTSKVHFTSPSGRQFGVE